MKKFFLLTFTIVTFILTGCISTFSVVKSDITTSPKYGKVYFQSSKLEQQYLDEFKRIGRQAIVEAKTISEPEKKKRLAKIENMEYVDNKYFYFTMAYNLPFLEEELNLKIKILDDSNKDYLFDYTLIPIKYTTISQNGQIDNWNYTYVIRTVEPLTKGMFYKMQVDFPDKKSIIYNIEI